MTNLRFNPATGTWMPSPEMRPKQFIYAQPAPLTRNTPHFNPIPLSPAYPIRPKSPRFHLQGKVWTPGYGKIPNRPVILPPRMKQLPQYVQDKAKWGQYAVSDTLPTPKVVPKPNLPHFQRYSVPYIQNGQNKIDAQMRQMGGVPASARLYSSLMKVANGGVRGRQNSGQMYSHLMTTYGPATQRRRQTRLKPQDLALNNTKGSNSQFLSFGSYLGRTIGNQ